MYESLFDPILVVYTKGPFSSPKLGPFMTDCMS